MASQLRSRNGMLSKKRQHGNAGGYILAILLLGGAITMGARLGPLYMDHNTMSNIIDKMASEQGVGIKGDRELRSMITKRFKLNAIRDFDINEHIRFERTGRGTELIMDYEVRMPLFQNIDIIATFNKETELSN